MTNSNITRNEISRDLHGVMVRVIDSREGRLRGVMVRVIDSGEGGRSWDSLPGRQVK